MALSNKFLRIGFFPKKKYVAIFPRSGAYVGERNFLLSASKGLCCKKKRRTLCSWEVLGADRGIAARELPRVSARSDGAHRDARALPRAPTHPTTRPGAYLDVPSLLERTASARCRLLLHVESRLCSPRHAGGCYERYEGTTSAGDDGWGLSCASRAAKATRSDFSGRMALTYLGVAWRAEHCGKPAKAAECALCCCRQGERSQPRR